MEGQQTMESKDAPKPDIYTEYPALRLTADDFIAAGFPVPSSMRKLPAKKSPLINIEFTKEELKMLGLIKSPAKKGSIKKSFAVQSRHQASHSGVSAIKPLINKPAQQTSKSRLPTSRRNLFPPESSISKAKKSAISTKPVALAVNRGIKRFSITNMKSKKALNFKDQENTANLSKLIPEISVCSSTPSSLNLSGDKNLEKLKSYIDTKFEKVYNQVEQNYINLLDNQFKIIELINNLNVSKENVIFNADRNRPLNLSNNCNNKFDLKKEGATKMFNDYKDKLLLGTPKGFSEKGTPKSRNKNNVSFKLHQQINSLMLDTPKHC